VQVNVVPLRGMDAGRRLTTLSSQPDVWIAEASFVRSMAGSIPYETNGKSLAQDSFVWVATKSQALANPLDWVAISQSAQNARFRVALPPVNSVEGMAACWSAAASYHDLPAPSAAQIEDTAFRKWLAQILLAAPDRNKAAVEQLATRPPQVDAGYIQNRELSMLSTSLFIAAAPAHNIVFNYPFIIRSNWQNLAVDEVEARKNAAAQFRDYLLSAGPQSRLAAYHLQTARAQAGGAQPVLDDQLIRALRFCWQ